MVIGKVIKMVEVSIQNEIVVLPALIHCCKYLLHVRPKQDTADAHFRRRLPEKFYLEHRFQRSSALYSHFIWLAPVL